jgi:hypothetical protein
MFQPIENNWTPTVINQFINYVHEVVENDPESHIDFDNLDIDDIVWKIHSALNILLNCYNNEYYKYEGDLQNDLSLCKSDIFSEFVNNLENTDELSEHSWNKIRDKLYELLDITDIDKDDSVNAKLQFHKSNKILRDKLSDIKRSVFENKNTKLTKDVIDMFDELCKKVNRMP